MNHEVAAATMGNFHSSFIVHYDYEIRKQNKVDVCGLWGTGGGGPEPPGLLAKARGC